MSTVLAKALSLFIGEDPVKAAAEVKRLGKGVAVVEKGFRGLEEAEWVFEATGWRIVYTQSADRIPCMVFAGYPRLRLCGSIGDVTSYSLPFLMRAALGWKPRKCPKTVTVVDVDVEAKMYIVNGIPCAVAMSSLGELLACTSKIRFTIINVHDYARVYGRLPVEAVPALEVEGRISYIPTPYTVEKLVDSLKKVIS